MHEYFYKGQVSYLLYPKDYGMTSGYEIISGIVSGQDANKAFNDAMNILEEECKTNRGQKNYTYSNPVILEFKKV